ncbi:Uncharacterised protein [Cronobacter sakazakii]|nr:Uncharacterised protein [Cronobacter sakazakii]
MTNEYEYAERFADLMERHAGRRRGRVNILMNYLMGFVEQATEGDEDKGSSGNWKTKSWLSPLSQSTAQTQRGCTDASLLQRN